MLTGRLTEDQIVARAAWRQRQLDVWRLWVIGAVLVFLLAFTGDWQWRHRELFFGVLLGSLAELLVCRHFYNLKEPARDWDAGADVIEDRPSRPNPL